MSKFKKSLLVSAIIIFVTVIALSIVNLLFGGGAGFCCGAPSSPASPYLEMYQNVAVGIGVLALVVGNIVIFLKRKRN